MKTPAGASCLRLSLVAWLAVGAVLDASEPLAGDQPETVLDAGVQPLAAGSPAPAGTDKAGEWVVAPIPTLNPAQGFGVQLIAQYIAKSPGQQSGTPPSIVGLGGFYTEQKSYGVVAGYLGHWQDDLWRPMVGAGLAQLNYDYYGVGNSLAELDLSIPLEQKMTVGLVQLLRRLQPGFYAGLRLSAANIEVATPELSLPPITVPAAALETTALAGGPVIQWDTRDNQFFPTRGQVLNASIAFNGGDQHYQIYQLDWNAYRSLGENTVLAARAYLRAAVGDAPFYALSQFGRGSDLRGYKSGKYRDRAMLAVQAEWRQRLARRWAYVVFAGVGEVAPHFDEFTTDNLLASAGAGLRFRLAESQPVNFRLDWAYGQDGPAVYVGVNEAF